MSFGGLDFIFDGQYSENYGLKIMSIGSSSVTSDASAGCGIDIFTDWVYRNPSAYHQGVAQNKPLEFDIEFVSEDELPGIMRSKISKWLFGRMDFCKLQIVQRDLQDIYFNCHLIDPQLTYIANYCHGIKCKVQCDAPWAWQIEKEYVAKPDADGYWKHYNDSDDTDYTYPIIEFQLDENPGGYFSIINKNDNGREFLITSAFDDDGNLKKDNSGNYVRSLFANQKYVIDCRNQLIKSTYFTEDMKTGEMVETVVPKLVSESFNKKFFRLVPGVNELELDGNFKYFKMRYSNARKVGG